MAALPIECGTRGTKSATMNLAERGALPPVPAAPGESIATGSKAGFDLSTGQRAELIAPLQLFGSLPHALLELVAEGSQTFRVAHGCYVFKHGETHNGFYVVVDGKVELLLPARAGDAKVLAVMERGMSFGEAAMFLNMPIPVSARSTGDTLVIFIPRQTLDRLLARRPEFAVQLLVRMSRRLHKLVRDIAGYTQKNACNRVAGYMLEQVQAGRKPFFRLPDRKRAIASRLSVAPETLSRTLRLMQADKIIRVSGYNIEVIDMQGLRQLARD